jgi:hypothetical protein
MFSLLKKNLLTRKIQQVYIILYIFLIFFQILMTNKYPILVISILSYKHDPILKANYIYYFYLARINDILYLFSRDCIIPPKSVPPGKLILWLMFISQSIESTKNNLLLYSLLKMKHVATTWSNMWIQPQKKLISNHLALRISIFLNL